MREVDLPAVVIPHVFTGGTANAAASVHEAIEHGAQSWREVADATGFSHEWARQLGLRMGVAPSISRPVVARRPPWNDAEVVERFWSLVDKNGPLAFGFDPPTRCWTWLGPTTPQGYGILRVRRFRAAAHRYAYRLDRGRNPWSVVDHLCHSYSRSCRGGLADPHRRCVNPEHLEVVTPGENARRVPGNRAYSTAPPKVFPSCRSGHRWTVDDALYDSSGRRICVWCLTGTEPS